MDIFSAKMTRYILVKILLPIAILTFAAYMARWTHIFRAAVFPYPHEIIAAGIECLTIASNTSAIIITLKRLLIVFLVSSGIGMAMAFFFHQFSILEEIFALPVDVIRSIPVVTLFPLFITLWGFTETTFMAVPVILTSVIMYIHLSAGLKEVVEIRLMLMRRWDASRLQMIRHLLLPSIAPNLFTGLRICISLQLILLLVAEMFLGAKNGIGTLIYDYQTVLQYDKMYFFIFLSGILGWAINIILEYLQKRIIYWLPQINANGRT